MCLLLTTLDCMVCSPATYNRNTTADTTQTSLLAWQRFMTFSFSIHYTELMLPPPAPIPKVHTCTLRVVFLA